MILVGRRRFGVLRRAVFAAFAAGPALLTALPGGAQSLPPLSAAADLDSKAVVFAFAWPKSRSALGAAAFEPGAAFSAPVMLQNFLPGVETPLPAEALKGRAVLAPTALSVARIGPRAPEAVTLPRTELGLVTHGDRIVPVRDPRTSRIDADTPVVMIFGVGRTWREASDAGRSRAVLPVSLIDSRTGGVRNGLASFLYGDSRPISDWIFQFSQETSPGRAADLWGTVRVSFESGRVPGAEARISAFEARQATAPKYRDWSALTERAGAAALQGFDGPVGAAGAVAVSGLIVEDVIYLSPCNTRHGPYPFCRQMRHGVHTMTIPLLGFVATAHLHERLGNAVLETAVGEVVPELARHPVWSKIRVRDLLGMATGLGSAVPERKSTYVPDDTDPAAVALRQAPTEAAKIAAAAQAPRYPWKPGEVFRFRPSDQTGLALLLDRLVRQRYGEDRSLMGVLQENFLSRLGIVQLHARVTADETSLPELADGLYPTTGQIVRIALALRQTQYGTRRTYLSQALVGEALSGNQRLGLPTGLSRPAGNVLYHLGFWRVPVQGAGGCVQDVPTGLGRGGSALLFMPNDVTAFRIASGDPDNPETRDSRDMVRVADAVKPLCLK